jgi:NADH-quinone oxidoreductase subunit B
MEVERNNTPGEDAPDVTPPGQAESAPPVSAEAAAAAANVDVPTTPGTPPIEEVVAPAAAAPPPAAGPERATPAAAPPATPRERPTPASSPVPGRVPAPEGGVAVAPTSRPVPLGIQLENARLTPVELEHPKAFYRSVLPGIMQVPADYLIAAARKSSLWPMTFGLACCAIEMIATYMAHHDLDRFGIVPWPSPRQCDVMIVAGTVTKKMAPAVKLLYQQMPNPKWVISMGACATNGGPYTRYDRVLQGVDKIIPVDVYVPGCPPRPEALIDGFIALQNKIMEERSRVG